MPRPKDFTPAQARTWVKYERIKHKTRSEIEARIKAEKRTLAMFAAPDFAAISAEYPNSNKAHHDLIAALEADLAALEELV